MPQPALKNRRTAAVLGFRALLPTFIFPTKGSSAAEAEAKRRLAPHRSGVLLLCECLHRVLSGLNARCIKAERSWRSQAAVMKLLAPVCLLLFASAAANRDNIKQFLLHMFQESHSLYYEPALDGCIGKTYRPLRTPLVVFNISVPFLWLNGFSVFNVESLELRGSNMRISFRFPHIAGYAEAVIESRGKIFFTDFNSHRLTLEMSLNVTRSHVEMSDFFLLPQTKSEAEETVTALFGKKVREVFLQRIRSCSRAFADVMSNLVTISLYSVPAEDILNGTYLRDLRRTASF